MTKDNIDIFERLATLESEARFTRTELEEKASEKELDELKDELEGLKLRLSYYDKLAVKWAGICMGVLGIGAFAGGHFDKLRERIIQWLLS